MCWCPNKLVSEHRTDLMAQKKNDARIDVMEQEMELMKEQLQKLTGIERSLEQMAQNMVCSLQSMEETQKLVAAMAVQKGSTAERGEDSTSDGSERMMRVKEKTPDHLGEAVAGVDGRPERPILAKEGGETTDVGVLSSGDWHGGKRLEMPVFVRDNLDDWIFRVERYFNIK